VTPAGQVTTFPPISAPAGTFSSAGGIVSGPGDDLWFSYNVGGSAPESQNFIGRVTTAGTVTLFAIPSFSSKSSTLYSVAAGADGNLWFTEGPGKNFVLGRMTSSGTVTQFPIESLDFENVANGPNGTLIVTGENPKGRNEVVGVSTGAAVTRFKIPAAISNAFGIYLGAAKGSLWFTNTSGAFKVGRITASGVAKSYRLSPAVPGLQLNEFMAIGQNGNLYALGDVNVGMSDKTTMTVYRLSPSKLGHQHFA
jgi:virginiamycin B lyase